MLISLIAAMAQNRVIGRDRPDGRPDLPWHLPDDFAYFKQKTSGHAIIMGRKSLDALGKPLPKRTNIVISRNPDFQFDGVTVVNTLEAALEAAQQAEAAHNQAGHETAELFVIGGAEIYALALPMANRIYLTEVQRTYEGNASFPEFDKTIWQEVSRQSHPADDRHEAAFDFVVYEKM
ncbi:dihydrofolate reductase [Fibrivirga algicola]|uniref:Dihydrofolate reductase n=1 Tax=Fibrivirga algicola TaxID=2950420 RepID=A0ABX0QC06_9BACT|nr:dihydrofolate reductase [Fibrivirga algicola]NID09911.1 dihydrofolate reductase [Fibrivirga algicola]